MDIEQEAEKRYPEPDQHLTGQQADRRSAFAEGADWALNAIFEQMHWSCDNPDHKLVYEQIADALGYTRTNAAPEPVIHRHPPHPVQTPYDF